MKLFKNKKLLILIVFICLVLVAINSLTAYKKSQQLAGQGGYSPDYYITYKTYDGTILARDEIRKNAPHISETLIPESPGKVFTGWDKDIRAVDSDVETSAQYLDVKNEDNVIALSTRYGKNGDMIKFPLRILGNIKLCGADITLSYDSNLLEFVKGEKTDKAVTVEKATEAGLIYIRIVSSENATGELDLSTLCFKVKGEERSDTDIKIIVKDIVQLDDEKNIVSADYGVADGRMYIY